MLIKNFKDIQYLNNNFKLPSFEEQMALVDKGYASFKYSKDGKLALFKYKKKVMFESLWFDYPELMECRGHVYCTKSGKIVQHAPRKSFNYTENGWWSEMSDDTLVLVCKKYNGFLANVTIFEDEVLVTTTGSFDSDFVKMANEVLIDIDPVINYTDSYEIIHVNDPHIVEEGYQRSERLTFRSEVSNYPFDYLMMTFGEAKELAQKDSGEGFMVYHLGDEMFLSPCKLKTVLYVNRKKIVRATEKSIASMYNQPEKWCSYKQIDYKYKVIVQSIIKSITMEQWLSFDEQDKILVIRNFGG